MFWVLGCKGGDNEDSIHRISEANDKVVTNAGFLVIAFFPTLILVLSLLQWRLDKRRDARKAARKHRQSSADWSGGW